MSKVSQAGRRVRRHRRCCRAARLLHRRLPDRRPAERPGGGAGAAGQRDPPDRRLARARRRTRTGSPTSSRTRRATGCTRPCCTVAGPLARHGDRATSTTPPPGLRNPVLGRAARASSATMTLDGKPIADARPRPRLAHVRDPRARRQRAARGRRRRREEPVQRRAVHARGGAPTITFTLPHRASPARYRWQCFVPCAAGFILGFGGPMQSLGYMDGFLHVV